MASKMAEFENAFELYDCINSILRTTEQVGSDDFDDFVDDLFHFDDINSGVTTKSRAKRTGRQANTASGVSRNWILFKELS